MKIATFNINNVVRRLPNLLEWLRAAAPDVVCLQELKATDASFPEAAIRDAGYHAVWRGQRSWNGVAILARKRRPILVRDELPGDPTDEQSRYIEAAVDGVLVACIYLPNGNPQPGPKFAYKLAWFDRLIAHAAELYAAGVPAVLAGDYNVVPTDLDIYPTKSWANDALLQPESSGGLSASCRDRLDRRDPHAASGGPDVHVLGLQAGSLAARRRSPPRLPPAQSAARKPSGAGRGRSRRPRPGRRQRSRARLDRAPLRTVLPRAITRPSSRSGSNPSPRPGDQLEARGETFVTQGDPVGWCG